MSKTIVEKAKCILRGVETDFDLGFEWANEYYDDYYQYFAHPDDEVRKWSLLIFTGGLGNWYLKSALIFRPIEEKKLTDGDFDINKLYHFENYIQSFLAHQVAIKQEFPLLYERIIWYLLWLDNRQSFAEIFTSYISDPSTIHLKKQLFNELRQVLTKSQIDVGKFQENHETIMKEVNLIFKPM